MLQWKYLLVDLQVWTQALLQCSLSFAVKGVRDHLGWGIRENQMQHLEVTAPVLG